MKTDSLKIVFQIVLIALFFSDVTFSQSNNWQRAYKSPTNYHFYGYDLCVSNNNTFYLTVQNKDPFGAYIIKINSAGDTLFSRFILNKKSFACVSDGNGGIVYTGGNSNMYFPATLVKYDNDGNIVWDNNYDSTNYSDCYGLIKTTDGKYVACGTLYYQGFIMKSNSNGGLIWRKKFPGSYDMQFYSLTQSNNNDGYLISGKIRETQSQSEGLIVKVDTSGNEIWRKKYKSPYDDVGIYNLRISNSNSGYYLGGDITSSQYGRNIIIIFKINESGEIIFIRRYPFFTGFNFYSSDISKLSENRILTLYYRTRFSNDTLVSGAFITDTTGLILTNNEYANTDYSLLRKITYINPGNIFFTGSSNHITSYIENLFVVKTDSTLYAPPVSVKNISRIIPGYFYLGQNYPNPFNNSTQITFGIKKKGIYKLTVYDVTGKLVDEFFNQNLEPGEYKTDFNAEKLSSGIYFYRLESGSTIITKKFVLLK